MNTKIFWLSIVAVLISFFGGFYFANKLNRNEITNLRGENEKLKKNETEKPPNESELALTDEEIRQKIAEADKSPNDFSFQRNMGLALYRYGAMKQDVNLISESARLLLRTYSNNPQDYDVIVALGNINYDLGFFKNDNKNFKTAREFYQKAIALKSNDADVRADYGSIFIFAEPSDLETANAELQKSLQLDPKNERALKFLIQVFLKQNKKEEAEKYLARLKEINPQTPNLDELNAQISADENKLQK